MILNVFTANESKPLVLGRQGENEVTTIQFPVKRWRQEYGNDGEFRLVHQRSCDVEAYPCTITETDDYVTWTITDADASCKGMGLAQLTYVIGGKKAKSEIFDTVVARSLNDTDTPPEPWESWIDTVYGYKTDAEEAAETANGYATDAYNEANRAKAAADSITTTHYADPESDGNIIITEVMPNGE